jgi:hypothetical protein
VLRCETFCGALLDSIGDSIGDSNSGVELLPFGCWSDRIISFTCVYVSGCGWAWGATLTTQLHHIDCLNERFSILEFLASFDCLVD